MNNQKTTISKTRIIRKYFPLFFLSSIIFLIAACTESFVNDDDLSNDIEILANSLSLNHGKIGISDAANDGIDEFYFLAPTVGKTPKFNGNFHANLQPVVEISDDLNFKNILFSFTRKGTGSNVISVNESEEFYSATWNTADPKVSPGKIYRIRVRIGERVLGFVDVGIFFSKPKQTNTNLIPVIQNQLFRVEFRIEDKICPAKIEVLPNEATIMKDGEQQFQAIVYNFYGEVLENQKITWSVGDGSIASINQSGLAKGLAFGFTSINAKVQDVVGEAFLFVQENETGPRPGKDVVVLNDVNPFVNIGLLNPNNVTFIKNLLNFDTPEIRGRSTKIWFDCGRNTAHILDTPIPCGNSTRYNPLRQIIAGEGYTLEDISSNEGTLVNIPQEVKIIFLWLPRIAYTVNEINALKDFANEGGRIVFVGEWNNFYGTVGLAVENQFLLNMGAVMRNVGNAVDCLPFTGAPYPILPFSSLRPHPITRDMTGLAVACASVIELGPNDFPLFYDTSNRFVLGGVAQIDTNPITELQNLRLSPNEQPRLRILGEYDPTKIAGN